mmetsp:Transcript_1104/g.1164  ORF Transcript_1104/g.1164 Transcript_1104/m.1164 type:complete len:163 (+) Transcript_1104:26-514(+)
MEHSRREEENTTTEDYIPVIAGETETIRRVALSLPHRVILIVILLADVTYSRWQITHPDTQGLNTFYWHVLNLLIVAVPGIALMSHNTTLYSVANNALRGRFWIVLAVALLTFVFEIVVGLSGTSPMFDLIMTIPPLAIYALAFLTFDYSSRAGTKVRSKLL